MCIDQPEATPTDAVVGQPRSANERPPLRLCIIAAVGSSIQVIYRGRLEYLRAQGFEVTVVCAPSELDEAIRARGFRLHTAPLTRAITPWADLRAIWNLWRFLRRERFDLVEVSFPKSALVGSIAAWLARAACAVHVLRGLAYQGQRGWRYRVLHASTAIPCRLAHETISISASARDAAYDDGVCARGTIKVLGSGSYTGVDLGRFSPAHRPLGAQVREQCELPADAVVVGYVGRLTREKGIVELVTGCRELAATLPDLFLLLIGDYETRQRPPDEIIEFIARNPRVRHVPWQSDVVPYYAAMDVVVLPSHREGLGNVLPEAAAMGLPTIASDATGCCDAMCPDVTGLQFPVGDAARLRDAIARLVRDAELRRTLGARGREWVAERFDHRRVWKLYAEEYRRLAEQAARR